MAAVSRRPLEVASRRVVQDAKLAIRDVYDAIVELVTNADDRYQILNTEGRIEIEIGRQGRGKPSILRVRDYADGLTTDQMNVKIGRIGGRVSGLEEGFAVRGTNSRGAKDIAALGNVTFESIAEDGRFHTCRIFENFEYEADDAKMATPHVRRQLCIMEGTGTVVTIQVDGTHTIPKVSSLVPKIASLVRLRDIVLQKRTELVVRGLSGGSWKAVIFRNPSGRKRVSTAFEVPGYPKATAKLLVYRARKKLTGGRADRFRIGGILVKSRHAIHEATLFDRSLEWDSNAHWFYGRLTCEAIDDLWNEYDERHARGDKHPRENPVPILDPSRKSGLTPDHPFVKALYAHALTLLRPLVEEERTRAERERARSVESHQTKRRLNALAKAANRFMEDFSDDAIATGSKGRQTGSRFHIRGYVLSPEYAQYIRGHSYGCQLTVLEEAFPEIAEGDKVAVQCLTSDLIADSATVRLEPLSDHEGALRARWSMKAANASPATGFIVRVGRIEAEATIEVLESEADRYRDLDGLSFERSRFRIRGDSPKRIRLLAPVALIREAGDLFTCSLSSDEFRVTGAKRLKEKAGAGIAVATLTVRALDDEAAATKLEAVLGSERAVTELRAVTPVGAGIAIKLEDIDYGDRRYRWNKNVLEIGARHPSLQRYLGPKTESYPGQDDVQFRVLLAEVVAEALCARRLQGNIEANPGDFEGISWDDYYRHFTQLMSRFLPKAHSLMVPDT